MSKVSVPSRLHALFWGAFSIGGFIAAFLLPILIYVNNIAYPLGLWPTTSKDPTTLLVSDQLIGSLFVLVTIGGSLFHGVFRFQTTLPELGMKGQTDRIVSVGFAIIAVGIIALLYFLLILNPTFLKMLTSIIPHPYAPVTPYLVNYCKLSILPQNTTSQDPACPTNTNPCRSSKNTGTR